MDLAALAQVFLAEARLGTKKFTIYTQVAPVEASTLLDNSGVFQAASKVPEVSKSSEMGKSSLSRDEGFNDVLTISRELF